MSDYNDVPRGPMPEVKSRPNVALIAGLIIAALCVVFFFQNGEMVSIDFLFVEKRTTIRWSILMAVVLGILLDRLVSIWWRRRKRKQNDD